MVQIIINNYKYNMNDETYYGFPSEILEKLISQINPELDKQDIWVENDDDMSLYLRFFKWSNSDEFTVIEEWRKEIEKPDYDYDIDYIY